MEIRRRVALNIKRIREAQGLSQEELAHRAGVHRTYVSSVERVVRNPTITVIEKLAVGLGVSASELVAEVSAKP